jgi:hypothetical protein
MALTTVVIWVGLPRKSQAKTLNCFSWALARSPIARRLAIAMLAAFLPGGRTFSPRRRLNPTIASGCRPMSPSSQSGGLDVPLRREVAVRREARGIEGGERPPRLAVAAAGWQLSAVGSGRRRGGREQR